MNEFKLGVGWGLTAVIAAVGLLVLTLGSVRTGGYVLAAAMIVGAIARLCSTDDRDNGLRIRRKLVDAGFFLALAAALFVVFATVKLS